MDRTDIVLSIIAGMFTAAGVAILFTIGLTTVVDEHQELKLLFLFPSQNAPFVWHVIRCLPGMLVGSLVSARVWVRAQEFLLTVGILTLGIPSCIALLGELTAAHVAMYSAILLCVVICLIIDIGGPVNAFRALIRKKKKPEPVTHNIDWIDPEEPPVYEVCEEEEPAAKKTPDFTGLLDAWMEHERKEAEKKMEEANNYRLDRRLGILNPGDAVTKEVTLGYWGEELRLDIRKWENLDLGKGISLTEDEVHKLREILDSTLFGT